MHHDEMSCGALAEWVVGPLSKRGDNWMHSALPAQCIDHAVARIVTEVPPVHGLHRANLIVK